MALYTTEDRDRALLEAYFRKEGLTGEVLETAIHKAEKEMAEGKPLAYIMEEAAFYDLLFFVNENVLIPRPDTERLVELAIQKIPRGGRFIDLGTGSGCIALTVLKHRPDLTAVAVDLSPDALRVAKVNAILLDLTDRVRFVQGDMKSLWFEDGVFDTVISNPPYIPCGDIPKYPTLSFEPRMALDGGEDGMDFYRAILSHYAHTLKKGGAFLFEIGFDQREAITALAKERGMDCKVTKDYGGNDRVALIEQMTE